MKIMKTIVSKSDNTVNWHNLLSKSFHISTRNPEKKRKWLKNCLGWVQ